MDSLYRFGIAVMLVTAWLMWSPSVLADTINLKAELTASNEVPPNNSKGAGSVTATFDTATKTLAWKGTYSGLTGDATMAHFHGPGEPGQNAGVAVWISTKGSAFPTSFEGRATLTDAQAAELLAGRWYVNVHTAANPAGEIRGQLVK